MRTGFIAARTILVLLHLLVTAGSHSLTRNAVRTVADWRSEAINHIDTMDILLYPPGGTVKSRSHLVKQHPIYNFLHTYYRYSTKNIKKYSPGLGILMEDVAADNEYLNQKFLQTSAAGTNSFLLIMDLFTKGLQPPNFFLRICDLGLGSFYQLPRGLSPDSAFGWITLSNIRNILHSTSKRQPFFGCFGLHEWAMLYSGRRFEHYVTISLYFRPAFLSVYLTAKILPQNTSVESSTFQHHFDPHFQCYSEEVTAIEQSRQGTKTFHCECHKTLLVRAAQCSACASLP